MGVSSPMLVALIRTPRDNSISTMVLWPSFAAQWSKLNWWSSLCMGCGVTGVSAMRGECGGMYDRMGEEGVALMRTTRDKNIIWKLINKLIK